MRMARAPEAVTSAFLVLATWGSVASSLSYPSLSVVEKALLTTATDDFGGHVPAFEAAAKWEEKRLRSSSSGQDVMRAPHLACTEYGRGFEAFSRLQGLLSSEAVRPVSHSKEHGACFFATASHAQVAAIAAQRDRFGLESLAPFPSALKLAPGVLEHAEDNRSGRLSARHGTSMRIGDVDGLNVELSPGTLAVHTVEARPFVKNLLEDLMSESLDLHSTNFWSDPALVDGEHLATAGGVARRSDWSMAATLVHELGKSGNTSPGDICSWDSVSVHHAADDILIVKGVCTEQRIITQYAVPSLEGAGYRLYVQIASISNAAPFVMQFVAVAKHNCVFFFGQFIDSACIARSRSKLRRSKWVQYRQAYFLMQA